MIKIAYKKTLGIILFFLLPSLAFGAHCFSDGAGGYNCDNGVRILSDGFGGYKDNMGNHCFPKEENGFICNTPEGTQYVDGVGERRPCESDGLNGLNCDTSWNMQYPNLSPSQTQGGGL